MAKTPSDIRSLARSHTARAINVLVGVMNERRSPPAARVAAATALLDRGWGKPTQALDHSGNMLVTLEDALQELGKKSAVV